MIKISSTAPIMIECDRCGKTLVWAPGGVVDMGTETVRDATRHGLLCGKTPEQLQRLSDALGAIREAVVAGVTE